MCGRYTLTSPDELVQEFGLGELPFALAPRYNIAPTQEAPVVLSNGGRAQIELFRWGLVPGWAPDTRGAARLINARAETVDDKPSFRDAFARRRCLVCADGFYEWRRDGKRRVPYYMYRADGRPIALAGIWEQFVDGEGRPYFSFATLTTAANELMSPIHDRMPVIIAPGDYQRWLDPQPRSRQALDDLLRPAPEAGYLVRQVSERVNSVANDGPACLRAGPDQQSLF